ncbi:hexosaminidase D [Xyrauchen texanus]|uniref:hexosaminidase D n=1 Tax=Xyrauchen texanus TaxID=154827 RepID=UPI002241E19B|nr:hexosaminidase D [Xyrauchen texanus]XP_051958964.1 hexosaminidase D [Xyrauchen texanus]XP_051958965.1 hexosaminidase D [Xyrauchen texanus]
MNMSLSNTTKLVHLDLKGAPPRISYLFELIQLFADLGANGILIEYEDMFPYEGELKVLQSKAQPPYSREEILSIQDASNSRGLEIIPLVQTFGHLEFVLKHKTFRELREVDYCLGTLNPHRKRGVWLVQEMLRQVMELHPKSTSLHIGGDEVYMLGLGEESKHRLSTPGHSVHQLFLSHIVKVAKGIQESFVNLKLIMWDDMLRSMTPETIKESGLVGLVQPMLLDYSPALDVGNTVMLMEKYKSAGMSQQWVASAFKGSTTVYTCITNTQRHVDNHLQWFKVAASLSAGIEIKGIALTGWQRYDHLSVLCELMPVSVPSLASCLQTLLQGGFTDEAQMKVVETFGTVEIGDTERLSSRTSSSFTGAKLAKLIVNLMSDVESGELRHFQNNMFVRGWFTPYHRQKRIISPLIAQQIKTQAKMILDVVECNVQDVRQEMCLLYPDSTVQEWMDQHVTPVLEPLQNLLRDMESVLNEMGLCT